MTRRRAAGIRLPKPRTAILAGACAALALAAWILWPTPAARAYPPARTRLTIDTTVCLLTGPEGATSINATAADSAAWKGILEAQATTNLRAQAFPVTGSETVQNAQTAINTLALRGCNLIITTGTTENAAATSQAHLFPQVRFVQPTSANTAVTTADAKAAALSSVAQHHS